MLKKILSLSIAMSLALTALLGVAFAADDSNRVLTMYGKYELALGEGPSPDGQRVQEAIEKLVGFKFNIIPVAGDTYNEKMNIVLASGEAFDWLGNIGGNPGKGWRDLSNDGLIMPLNDLINQYGANLYARMQDGYKATTDATGQIWGVPWYIGNHWGQTPTIRVDWAKAAGFENLPRTVDEFEQYMEYVATHDLNGNGLQDEIPLLPITQDYMITELRGLIMGDAFVGKNYLDADGTVKPYYAHPSYVDFLDKLRDWYAKGYIYKEFFVIKGEQANDLIAADRVGTYMNWYSMVLTPFTAVNAADPSKNYAMLPALQTSTAGITSAYNNGTPYQDGVYIPKSSKNPDLTIKYLNWMMTEPENHLMALYGFEGEHWEWVDKDALIYKQFDDAHDKYYRLMCPAVNFSWNDKPFVGQPNDTYRSQMYFNFQQQALAPDTNYSYAFDLYCPYVLTGTDLEMLPNDGPTLMAETELKYIIGEIGKDELVSAIQQYMDIYGNTYSKVYTEEYNAFKGIK